MSTAPRPATIARELENICGAANVRSDEPSLKARAIDGVVPQGIVAPATPDEVAAVLKFAAARELVVVPVGGFSRQHIGRAPARVDIVVELTRMNAIQYYEPGDLTIGVQAGAKLADVLMHIESHGQMLPLDPASAARTSIGGTVATCASGPLRHGYGTVRDFCLGVQFATAEGKVAKAGGRVVKNVAGYDVTKLMVGSYGTLAVITSANFRVYPRPQQTRTFAGQFDSTEDALRARNAVVLKSALTPLAFDVLSPEASQLLMPQVARHAWTLLLRAGGSDNVLGRYRHDLGTMVTWESEGDAEARLWTTVADFPNSCFERDPNAMVVRVAVPQQELARVVEAAIETADANGFNTVWAGRAITPIHIAFTPTNGGRNYQAVLATLRKAVGNDGSAVVTHCPTDVKRAINVWGATAADLNAMQTVKRTLDPGDILNRGRFLL